jgi:hypothetical protein
MIRPPNKTVPKLRWILPLIAWTALHAQKGADISGTYHGTGQGTGESTLVLLVKGADVTGTLKNHFGEFKLVDGSVNGEDLFFNIFIDRDGDHFKMTYRGHSFGNEIQFKIEAGERMLDLIVKKAS